MRSSDEPSIITVSSCSQVLSDYCANTTGHGFQYWFSAGSTLERAFWVVVVFIGLLGQQSNGITNCPQKETSAALGNLKNNIFAGYCDYLGKIVTMYDKLTTVIKYHI